LEKQNEPVTEKIKQLESLVLQNSQQILFLQGELKKSGDTLSTLQSLYEKLYRKTFATCIQCHTEYDLLTHHYSIGLYDNLVFVKCPKCHKDMAIDRIDGLKRE
jgi:hypothetical protein